jgi:hypothetical protein
MPAFASLDWRRFDVQALIVWRGVATIEQVMAARCEEWLRLAGYQLVTLDFSRGIGAVVGQLACCWTGANSLATNWRRNPAT